MAGVAALPAPDIHSTTSLVEALHFRRGFHYIAVREMEMEIPIPSLPSINIKQGHRNLMVYVSTIQLHNNHSDV